MSKKDFLKLIQEQRKKSKKEKFNGTFIEFLERVKEDPSIADSSHKKLYDVISSKGVSTMPDSDSRKSKIFENENIKKVEIISHIEEEETSNLLKRFFRSKRNK